MKPCCVVFRYVMFMCIRNTWCVVSTEILRQCRSVLCCTVLKMNIWHFFGNSFWRICSFVKELHEKIWYRWKVILIWKIENQQYKYIRKCIEMSVRFYCRISYEKSYFSHLLKIKTNYYFSQPFKYVIHESQSTSNIAPCVISK